MDVVPVVIPKSPAYNVPADITGAAPVVLDSIKEDTPLDKSIVPTPLIKEGAVPASGEILVPANKRLKGPELDETALKDTRSVL
jgi:hypothetical protein